MNDQPTLESLMFHWDDGYIFAYARDRWIAIRRDGIWFMAADTLALLETAIEADDQKNPVLSECDPLDLTRDYLATNHVSEPECPGDLLALIAPAAEAILRHAAQESVILADLRAMFPDWDIHYSAQIRGWIAERKNQFISHSSPQYIRIALTLRARTWNHSANRTSPSHPHWPEASDGP